MLDQDDLDEIDLSVTHAILMLYDAGASRSQAERALRERIGIMFDALDEFEDASTSAEFFPRSSAVH